MIYSLCVTHDLYFFVSSLYFSDATFRLLDNVDREFENGDCSGTKTMFSSARASIKDDMKRNNFNNTAGKSLK